MARSRRGPWSPSGTSTWCRATRVPQFTVGSRVLLTAPHQSRGSWSACGRLLGSASRRAAHWVVFFMELSVRDSVPTKIHRPPACLARRTQRRPDLIAPRPVAHRIEHLRLLPQRVGSWPRPESPRLFIMRIPGHAYGRAGVRRPRLAMRGEDLVALAQPNQACRPPRCAGGQAPHQQRDRQRGNQPKRRPWGHSGQAATRQRTALFVGPAGRGHNERIAPVRAGRIPTCPDTRLEARCMGRDGRAPAALAAGAPTAAKARVLASRAACPADSRRVPAGRSRGRRSHLENQSTQSSLWMYPIVDQAGDQPRITKRRPRAVTRSSTRIREDRLSWIPFHIASLASTGSRVRSR